MGLVGRDALNQQQPNQQQPTWNQQANVGYQMPYQMPTMQQRPMQWQPPAMQQQQQQQQQQYGYAGVAMPAQPAQFNQGMGPQFNGTPFSGMGPTF